MSENRNQLAGKIESLESLIKDRNKANTVLERKVREAEQTSARYQDLFNRSGTAIWEFDIKKLKDKLEVYGDISAKTLRDNLINNPGLIKRLLRSIRMVRLNDYSKKILEAENKLQILAAGIKIFTEESYPAVIEFMEAVYTGKEDLSFETSLNTVKGNRIDIIFSAFIPQKDSGNVIISMMNITERKKIELAIKKSILKAKEERKRSEVMQNIILTLTSSLDQQEILTSILREVKRIIPYTSACIRMFENGYMKVAGAAGYEKYGAEDFILKSAEKAEELGDSLKYMESGKISIISDTRTYPGWTEYPETSYILGYIGLPIKSQDTVLGLLSLDSDKTDFFKSTDSEKLKPFGYAASVALQNAKLFSKAENEIQKRIAVEKSLRKTLHEKEILLKEIHHRVKNNLSLIISLINLQSDVISDQRLSGLFEDLKQRVYTISLVHEQLYRGENFTSIDFKTYLFRLFQSIRTSARFIRGMDMEMDIKYSISLKTEILVPLALLINELIINSVKYSSEEAPGMIKIKLREQDKVYIITYSDGIENMAEIMDSSDAELSRALIDSLAIQLGGSVVFGPETSVNIPV